ncbi:MAG: aminotransferase class V-fold PLP-dependent enzyme [Acidimicrobiia bacterium]|nr:aminotransferase class V-fold PLP-dependent enzyme [Acidimicrobiia bacterium]MYL08824.1 aminotransferase class V-fold PLP-dependent enzyme [Acidimicrobiia bacterium]
MTGRHYLDHASTSPIRPEALAAMNQWWAAGHGDPSRMHAEALTARYEIEQARQQVADCFGARSREVVFTSGATESIVAAVRGAAHRGTHQVLSAVEHSAVRLSVERLKMGSHGATVVGADSTGRVDPAEMAAAIGAETAAIHCQWANHEVGTVQPVADVVSACRQRSPEVLIHIDAAAAAGHIHIDFAETGADLMSISAHKFGGPPGIGALLVRRGLRLVPLLEGGDQERARRAGLENGAAIAGFAAACAALQDGGLEQEASQAQSHTDGLRDLAQSTEGVELYGHSTERLPHLVCLGIADVEPQAVLIALDRAGVAAHSGSSCASESLEPSPVLEAMGVDAHHSLRLSVGWSTVDEDVVAAADALKEALADLRQLKR